MIKKIADDAGPLVARSSASVEEVAASAERVEATPAELPLPQDIQSFLLFGILTLLKPLLGTALGIYTLWVLAPSASGAEYKAIEDRSGL